MLYDKVFILKVVSPNGLASGAVVLLIVPSLQIMRHVLTWMGDPLRRLNSEDMQVQLLWNLFHQSVTGLFHVDA